MNLSDFMDQATNQVPFPGPDATDEDRAAWRAYLEAKRAEAAEADRARRGYAGQYSVGDGITRHIGSDAQAYTVVRVSASGTTIWVQGDKATLKPGWKPEIVPGGFAGHCVNQHTQEYDYERQPDAPITAVRLTKRGWAHRGLPFTPGRHAFHDYNF